MTLSTQAPTNGRSPHYPKFNKSLVFRADGGGLLLWFLIVIILHNNVLTISSSDTVKLHSDSKSQLVTIVIY